ncbi:hypothetical protein TRIP_D420227 [uncultured Paludibacter sp.]|nr:hypothetical protein TRIP_D420227 [uncultured Paludibacter sp.]
MLYPFIVLNIKFICNIKHMQINMEIRKTGWTNVFFRWKNIDDCKYLTIR